MWDLPCEVWDLLCEVWDLPCEVWDLPCEVWDLPCEVKIQDIQKDVLKLEVWHEHEHLGVGVVKDIRDLKGLGRLVKGTTAPDQLLLGTVTLPLKVSVLFMA
ncbi:hypothetical protein FHG87_025501 [Trinorchestia longiramus]|nr:hypothetical protein FHG87_025501 [Trinorchestia longiramus]